MKSKYITVAVMAGLIATGIGANAQISQQDQERAAQRAYQASSQAYGEAGQGWQQAQQVAQQVRDTCIAIGQNAIANAATH